MELNSKKRYFSGIQPSGSLHIGNYFGAIKNWIALQDEYNGIFGIVDLHAITEPYDPAGMPGRVIEAAGDYLAAGVDPERSLLIVQSYVPEHAELMWLLNSITPLPWLERVPTFKDKAAQYAKSVNAGLLNYPVLMAADIILYKSEIVPVGEDQIPHLELTREIVRSFNARFGKTFPEPEAYLGPGARIMSLIYPDKKMSKSLGAANYIALGDSPEEIRSKLAAAVTDAGPAVEPMGPGTRNLFALAELFMESGTLASFRKAYDDKTIRYSELKMQLAKDIAKTLEPLRERRRDLLAKPSCIREVLLAGCEEARKIAVETLAEVKEKMGLKY
ncbi:MAG: tryptophan--tRNA ligase [Actinobacteria bacterium]|nr:tryptophan--tRNA ligase [Actinomycetota bacterium]